LKQFKKHTLKTSKAISNGPPMLGHPLLDLEALSDGIFLTGILILRKTGALLKTQMLIFMNMSLFLE